MEMTGAPHVLTDSERVLLDTLEERVENAEAEHFRATAWAMREIRDLRLYRDRHETFHAYANARWGYSRQHVNRLIRAADVCDDLEGRGLIAPHTESHARPLYALDEAARDEVVARVAARGGFEKVSRKTIENIVEDMQGCTAAVSRRRDMVLVTKGGKVGPSTSARSRIIRGLRTIADEADALQALGPYAIADMLASMSESESNEVRELALKGCRLLQRFNESWLVGRDDPEQPQDGQQDISTLGFLAA